MCSSDLSYRLGGFDFDAKKGFISVFFPSLTNSRIANGEPFQFQPASHRCTGPSGAQASKYCTSPVFGVADTHHRTAENSQGVVRRLFLLVNVKIAVRQQCKMPPPFIDVVAESPDAARGIREMVHWRRAHRSLMTMKRFHTNENVRPGSRLDRQSVA